MSLADSAKRCLYSLYSCLYSLYTIVVPIVAIVVSIVAIVSMYSLGNDRTLQIEVRPDGRTPSLWVRPDAGPDRTGPEVPAGPIAGL